MSHIGIFGGTFDPIHNGHLITVEHVLKSRNLDKVIFIPSYVSPFKTDIKASLPEERLEMVRIAIEGNRKFECSDYEIVNKGVSYTIGTITEFKKLYDMIDLIIGFDNIISFDKWKDPEEIFKLVNVVVMKREVDSIAEDKNNFMGKAIYINTPVINISGTEIRKRVRNNLPIENLVPEKVNNYILTNKLYQPKIL